MKLTGWGNDLVLGVRLAVGGGRTTRTGLIRLALGALGIGLAVLVLLVAASVGAARESQEARAANRLAAEHQVPGVDPLLLWRHDTEFRRVTVERKYVRAGGPVAPLPPGVDRLPAPGESLLSPALADLLAAPEGELLRPRLPERVVGTIGTAGMVKPTDLVAVIGAPPSFENGDKVYGFGPPADSPSPKWPTELFVVLALGLVVLITPVFVFIASSSRIAGAERDRRMAALRLVGADARQLRRIAAAESLVSAAFGLVLGGALFMVVRSMAADISVADKSYFPEDLTPPVALVAVIVVVVPVLALATTQIALRRIAVEPLNVVRQAKPVKRRMLWRFLLLAGGFAILFTIDPEDPGTVQMIVGAAMLLLGIPVVLPWLLEWCVGRLNGNGKPSFQLATRRLQLDPGTPARVVSGVGVVLAGAIAMQMMLTAQATQYDDLSTNSAPYANIARMHAEDDVADAAWARLRDVSGVTPNYLVRTFSVRMEGGNSFTTIVVADCATVVKVFEVAQCQDGETFTAPWANDSLANRTVEVVNGIGTRSRVLASIRLPEAVRDAEPRPTAIYLPGAYVMTPGALPPTRGFPLEALGAITVNPDDPDAVEHFRNAVEPFAGAVSVMSTSGSRYTEEAKMFFDLRNGLMIGSIFTLTLGALSLLVLAVEQIRERRRAIAALSATGVPVGTLARSLLWQNAIPMLLTTTVALAIGIAAGGLFLRVLHLPFTVDWTTIGSLTTTAAALVMLVTALTLPSLRGSTRLTALRTE